MDFTLTDGALLLEHVPGGFREAFERPGRAEQELVDPKATWKAVPAP